MIPLGEMISPVSGICESGGASAPVVFTLVRDFFIASGTWTSPATFYGVDGTPSQATVECTGKGGDGVTATGSGGGGEYRRSVLSLSPSTAYDVTINTGADAADTTFNSTSVVAKGGRIGGTGTGGTGGTGDVGFNGANGVVSAGSVSGGGSGGSEGAGSGATPGPPDGAMGGGATPTAGYSWGGAGGSTAASAQVGREGCCIVSYRVPATAGFPRVDYTSIYRATGGATSHVFPLPSGTGGLLLAVIAGDNNPTVTVPSDWTSLGTVANGTQDNLTVCWKVASGGDDTTIGLDASLRIAVKCWRIQNAGTPEWTTVTGTGNADSPNHDHGSSVKGLWLSVAGLDANANGMAMTGSPTNYSSVHVLSRQAATGVILLAAERMLEASAEDPGAWANVTETWVAATVLVPPA